ncbi:MAG: hypothetical protein WCK51_12900 [Armatimonadota bacterium]
MPILSGLLFAASMTIAMQDDLIHDKQYVVVKNNEQGTSAGAGAGAGTSSTAVAGSVLPLTEVQTRDLPSRPAEVIEVPRLAELPIVGNLFATNPSSDQLRRIPELKKDVSCAFVDASATDVLKWLSKQGVNFAGSSDSMPKGRLSLALKNVPLYEALDAIGEVFGGYWSLRGKTLVFRAGRSYAIAPDMAVGRSIPARPLDPKRPYSITVPGMAVMPPMGAMPPMSAEGFRLRLDQNAFGDLAKLREIPPMSQEERAKMQKDLAVAREEISKSLKEVERVREVDIRASRAELDKARKDMEKVREIDVRAARIDMERARKDMEKAREEMTKAERAHREASSQLKDLGERMKKLMGSMTPAQWDLHKKQGHLMFNDLTKEQQKMLAPDGKFKGNTVQTTIDGKSLTIKG